MNQMSELRTALEGEIGVSTLQIVESVAYSMAMVVRVALGLTAEEASVGVLYSDSLPGWIALATARHLKNSGCETRLVQCDDQDLPSPTLSLLKKPLQFLNVIEYSFDQLKEKRELKPFLGSCHNLICGVSLANGKVPHDRAMQIIESLNENAVPVHSIDAPLGVNLDSGEAHEQPLYSSSTLSLGIPYKGLGIGNRYVGRHYLADISIPAELSKRILGLELPTLFAEQPVIQIFPEEVEEQ